MTLRIAFLCDEYPPFRNGGIGTYTNEVAERLVERGHQVFVFGIFPDVSEETVVVQNGVQIIKLPPSRVPVVGNRFKVYRAVKSLAAKSGLDILETQEFGGNIAFWPKTDFKIIVRLHGSITNISHALKKSGWKNHFWRILEKKTLLRADHIVSVSKFTADSTKKIFGISRPIDVIYNGITLPRCNSPEQSTTPPFRVVFAGTLLPMKGFVALINAWQTVIKSLPDAQLHIAGKDPLGLMNRVHENLGDTSSVTYHGVLQKQDLEDLYSTAHLGVYPSFIEAFSLAPMEAMAVGLPVIYTELASGRELIEDGEHGKLVNPNDESSIAHAILDVARLPAEERQALGLRGKKRIQDHFSIERLIDNNEDLMHRML